MLEKHYREYDIFKDCKAVQKEVNQLHDAKASKSGILQGEGALH
ncbi:MAG: hypothetical protein ABIR84_08855 [Candidatus Nitrotoga sp.]